METREQHEIFVYSFGNEEDKGAPWKRRQLPLIPRIGFSLSLSLGRFSGFLDAGRTSPRAGSPGAAAGVVDKF